MGNTSGSVRHRNVIVQRTAPLAFLLVLICNAPLAAQVSSRLGWEPQSSPALHTGLDLALTRLQDHDLPMAYTFLMWIPSAIAALLAAVIIYDLFQKKHAILRNFPILGHFRYIFELVGPELRQYIVTSNNEERPFNRDQRSWIYASSKRQNNYFGFGTDNELELSPNYIIIKHSAFPLDNAHPGEPGYNPMYPPPCAKVLGGYRGRRKAFRPHSIVNVSGMSFGSLSAAAIEALNKGCVKAGCLHNTGEGGVSPYHKCGGELIWQIGAGYFGCRDERGNF